MSYPGIQDICLFFTPLFFIFLHIFAAMQVGSYFIYSFL